MEWLLNNVANRFQLNFKKNVGPTSQSIRTCEPKNLEEWRNYYYKKVRSEAHIDDLGKILFDKIETVIAGELQSVTEQDCKDWMKNLVIDRVYEGYVREVQVIKDVLQEKLTGVQIKPAPDEWDRRYNVDYFIEVNGRIIGIQIKPLDIGFTQQVFARYIEMQKESHEEFASKYGGRVFYVFSAGEKDSKEIQNPEVIEDIRKEIGRLSGLQ